MPPLAMEILVVMMVADAVPHGIMVNTITMQSITQWPDRPKSFTAEFGQLWFKSK